MKRLKGLSLPLVFILLLVGFIVAIIVIGRPTNGEAAPNTSIIITQPPTWCQEGNWTIDDWTYIGKRCTNLVTPTPTPAITLTPVFAFPYEFCGKGCLICMDHLGNCTYIPGKLQSTPIPTLIPTSTPTPTCWTVRYYPQYSPNSLNTEPPWSSNFNPMSLEMIPQSYNGCDGAAINKVQYWDPYDRIWVEGAWGLTDYNYWKEVYTGLLTVEYKEGRMCGCK